MSESVLLRELFLIRHGESLANIGIADPGNLDETQDPVLSPLGEEQAAKLGEWAKTAGLDAVYSSGLRRAAATAGEAALNSADRRLFILPDLCEIGINPDYPGQSLKDLAALCPGVKACLAEGIDEDTGVVVPDPTPKEFEERYFERARKVFEYFENMYNSGEKIALVSHAGFLTYMIFYLIGYRDRQPAYDFRLSNTGITRILFYEPGTNQYGDVIFDCVNERKHLGDTPVIMG